MRKGFSNPQSAIKRVALDASSGFVVYKGFVLQRGRGCRWIDWPVWQIQMPHSNRKYWRETYGWSLTERG
jgi:G:T-mismatch repair DNA endonuclease (very short patch repair protein)